jgi:flagellar protein FliO/FliZ
MKRLAVLLMGSLLVPACAFAAGGGPDIAGSLAQTVGSLILVVGIILILYWAAGKFMKLPKGGGNSRYMRVVETRHLAPKKSLVLVEVGGEYLLLSNSGEGVTFIKQIEMLEEIEVVEQPAYATMIPDQLKNKIKTLVAAFPRGEARLAQFKKSGGFT